MKNIDTQKKAAYLAPRIDILAIHVERGFANTANGFAADDSGNVLGTPGDAGNGYDSIDNGSY